MLSEVNVPSDDFHVTNSFKGLSNTVLNYALDTSVKVFQEFDAVHRLRIDLFLKLDVIMSHSQFLDLLGVFLTYYVINFVIKTLNVFYNVLLSFPAETVN